MKKKNGIRNKKQLDQHIRELRLQKEIQKQKLLADVEILKNGVSTLEAGLQTFNAIAEFFRKSSATGMSPKERLKNMGLNLGLDILAEYLAQRTSPPKSENPETEKNQEHL